MKIAVVTPYFRESTEQLARCHESVRAQTVPASHILVADGHPDPQAAAWASHHPASHHLALPRAHADFGCTPRALGAAIARARGFDAIQLLDADCWLRPDHLERMVATMAAAGTDFVSASRSLYATDGSELFHLDPESNGSEFCDTNCMFFARPAFWTIELWARLTREETILCDQVVWRGIREKLRTAHCPEPTVCYTSTLHFHYAVAGRTPPAGAKLILSVEGKVSLARYDAARDLFLLTRADGSIQEIPPGAIRHPSVESEPRA